MVNVSVNSEFVQPRFFIKQKKAMENNEEGDDLKY